MATKKNNKKSEDNNTGIVFSSNGKAIFFAFLTILVVALLAKMEESKFADSKIVINKRADVTDSNSAEASKDINSIIDPEVPLSFTNKSTNIEKEIEMVADHAIAKFKVSNGKTFADFKAISKKESYPKDSLTEYNNDNIIYKSRLKPENKITLTVKNGKVVKEKTF